MTARPPAPQPDNLAERRQLRPGGLYLLNVIDRPPHGFARAEAATLLEVFTHVAVAAPAGYLEGDLGGNFVFVASDAPIDAAAFTQQIADRAGIEVMVLEAGLDAFIDGARVLTDDFAPVDQLITQ